MHEYIYRPIPQISSGTNACNNYPLQTQNQPLQRESVKGLFTFYREQDEAQNQLIIAQNKNNVIGGRSKGHEHGNKRKGKVSFIKLMKKYYGNQEEQTVDGVDVGGNQSKKQESEGLKKDKHTKSKQNKLLKSNNGLRTKAVSQDNKMKSKKKNKVLQLIKNKIIDSCQSQKEIINNVTQKSLITIKNDEDRTQKFLKQIIKRRINRPEQRKLKTMQAEAVSSQIPTLTQQSSTINNNSKAPSMKNFLNNTQQTHEYQYQQQSNKYIFPFKNNTKQLKTRTQISQQSEGGRVYKYQRGLADKINERSQQKNNRKIELFANIDGFCIKDEEIQQKRRSCNRRYTDTSEQQQEHRKISNSMNINVRNNFFSDHRTKMLKRSIELKYEQDNTPISPATRIVTPKNKSHETSMKQSSSIKLPLIKMSKQLQRIEQITEQAQNQKIYSSKVSNRTNKNQIDGAQESKSKQKSHIRSRKKTSSKKKLHGDLERCQLVLIDMSRSQVSEVKQKRDQGLTDQKKLIFKKLGLKI